VVGGRWSVVGGRWSVVDLEQYGAIRLFVQIARMHAPDFALSAEVAPAVAGICRLVAGLPLGIELAASWTRLLPCAEIAGEIAQNLDFLADAAPDLPARQQSLRAVFDYSWGLLAPAEQQMLRQLAVFRGSFTREAATSVVELRIENEELKKDAAAASPAILNSPFSILNLLASLVDKSLVRRVAAGAGATQPIIASCWRRARSICAAPASRRRSWRSAPRSTRFARHGSMPSPLRT
jgi:predicted ATPase